MKKTNKKSILFFTSIVLALLFAGAAGIIKHNHKKNIPDPDSLPIEYGTAPFAFDLDNIPMVIGDADYVFVAHVEEVLDTDYKWPVTTVREGKEVTLTTPYTNYKVSVLNNIKGELITDEPIIIQKCGGISEDGSHYFIIEECDMPETGKNYIFAAYVQEDGTTLVSGKNPEIDSGNTDSSYNSITADKIYQEYLQASRNPAETNREHTLSPYDISNQ